MDENIDVKKELLQLNQEALLNKKKRDIDTAVESFLAFYDKFTTDNMAEEINDKVCSYLNIKPDSELGKINYNTITNFFFLTIKQLKAISTACINSLKERLVTFEDQEYNKELGYIYVTVSNKLVEYCSENINMLSDELTSNCDSDTKGKIKKYVYEMIVLRMGNIIREKLSSYIQLIDNNNKENKKRFNIINEKTIK